MDFERGDIEDAAARFGVRLPKNLGDVIYTFRYRARLPESILSRAPAGEEWVILPAGRARYSFVASASPRIEPNIALAETKIADSTPGVISMYALTDEQALLAKLRYNRLVDTFTRVTCYSLQSHLRTAIPGIGQIETDEVYVGVDRKGAHYVFPVQAKGGKDAISIVQIAQDLALCEERFPSLRARPIATQFIESDLIAMFELERQDGDIRVSGEKHYRLVPPDGLGESDLEAYALRSE